jgi:hypothetical protein
MIEPKGVAARKDTAMWGISTTAKKEMALGANGAREERQ